jgi:multicomponent Na+:H+ antiporter subunit D
MDWHAFSVWMPAVAVFWPVFLAILLRFGPVRLRRLARFAGLAGAIGTTALVLAMCGPVLTGSAWPSSLSAADAARPWGLGPWQGLGFRADAAGVLFGLASASVWSLVALHSCGQPEAERAGWRVEAARLLALGGAMGTYLAAGLPTLVPAAVAVGLAVRPLVQQGRSAAALRAGRKWLLIQVASGLALGLGLLFTLLGAGGLTPEAGAFSGTGAARAALAAFTVGFGFLGGLFPLHLWLPDVQAEAPAADGALLTGVLAKTSAAGLFRVMSIAHWGSPGAGASGPLPWLLVAGAATIILGSAGAMREHDVRRRLAHSAVGQMGHIYLGMALGNAWAVTGALFHVFSHAVVRSLLCLVAGDVTRRAGRGDVHAFSGSARAMPVHAACLAVGALGVIGIPPLSGFLSKWAIGQGALRAGLPAYALVLMVSSFLNACYYLPEVIEAFFGSPHGEGYREDQGRQGSGRAGASLALGALVVLAALTIVLPLLPRNLPLDLAALAARACEGR